MLLADAAHWLAMGLDVAAKSTVILLAAMGVSLMFRRRSAAVRHFVWTLAVMALVCLPLLSIALPRLQVPILPGWATEATTGETARTASGDEQHGPLPSDLPPMAPVVAPPAEAAEGPDGPTLVAPGDWAAAPAATGDEEPPEVVASPAPVGEGGQTPAVAAPASRPWAVWAAVAWAVGFGIMTIPLLVGTFALWRLARRATPVTDPSWPALLARLRKTLGIRREVRLRQSGASLIPLTWGLLRPVILLPAEANDWPDQRKRIVLLHELAHVKRADCLTQSVARVARAMYWFNPLVYLAIHMLRIERERSCDDVVLTAGCSKASEYAHHLLELVTTLRSMRCPSLAAVAMARKSHFESRLRAILDPARRRRVLTRLAAVLVLAIGLGIILPLACLTPTAAHVTDEATEPERIASLWCEFTVADDVAAQPTRQPLKVLTPVNDTNWVLPTGTKVWFGTDGGVSMLDRTSGRWTFYTRYDGLAANKTTQLISHDGDLLAFHSHSDSYSILKKGATRWQSRPLARMPRPKSGRVFRSSFAAVGDSLWCVYWIEVGNGLSSPAVLELHQYDRKHVRLRRRINIYELPGLKERMKRPLSRVPLWPTGLVAQGKDLWFHASDRLFKIDPDTGATLEVPLPGKVRSLARPYNRILGLAGETGRLWLGLTRGVASLNTVTNECKILPGTEKLWLQNGALARRGRYLWLPGDVKKGGLRRYDVESGELTLLSNEKARWPRHIAATDAELWLAHGGPAGAHRLDRKTNKWESYKHTAFYGYGSQVVIVGDHACAWNKIYPGRAQGPNMGWLEDYNLKTGKVTVQLTGQVGLMVPHGGRIWLVSDQTVFDHDPRAGTLRRHSAGGLWRPKSVLARRGETVWMLARFGRHLLAFDSRRGRITATVDMEEQWARRNARFLGVSDKYVYAHYKDNGSRLRFLRYSLADKKWQPLKVDPKLGSYWAPIFVQGRLWIPSRDKLYSIAEGAEDVVTVHAFPGDGVRMLEDVDGVLQIMLGRHFVRFAGGGWHYMPRPEESLLATGRQIIQALDATGKPADRHGMLVYGPDSELSIRAGRADPPVAPGKFRPIQPRADGTIVLPAQEPKKAVPIPARLGFVEPDTVKPGLYLIGGGPQDLRTPQRLYELAAAGKAPKGSRRLVARLHVNAQSVGNGPPNGARVVRFSVGQDNTIGGVVEIIHPANRKLTPQGEKSTPASLYLLAELPKLPPGRYTAAIAFTQAYRTKDGKVHKIDTTRSGRIASMRCEFRVVDPASLAIAPLEETIRSLGDIVILATGWNVGQDVAYRGIWEIRTADNKKCVARVPHDWAMEENRRSERFSLNDVQQRHIGILADGEYLVAWTVAGKRCSNVTRFRINREHSGKKLPLLELAQLEPPPRRTLPTLVLRARRHTKKDPAPGHLIVGSPTLGINGKDHHKYYVPSATFGKPLPVGGHYASLLDMGMFEGASAAITPGKKYVIFATVERRASNSVTLRFDRPLGKAWDRAAPAAPTTRPKAAGGMTGAQPEWLWKEFASSDSKVWPPAARELGARADEKTVDRLIELAAKGPEAGRGNALYALGFVRGHTKKVTSALAGFAAGKPRVGWPKSVFYALNRQAVRDTAAIPYVIEAVRADGSWGAQHIEWPAVGRPAVGPLLKEIKRPGSRGWATHALARLGLAAPEAIAELTVSLKHPNAVTRRAAARALGLFGPEAGQAVGPLLELLADAEAASEAAVALGKIDDGSDRVVRALAAALRGKGRHGAARGLASIGARALPALDALIAALGDKNASVQAAVVEAIGRIGPKAAKALPRLRPLLASKDLEVRCAAALAVWRVSGSVKEVMPVLIADLKSRNEWNRQRAAETCGSIGPAGAPAVGALVDVLGRPWSGRETPYLHQDGQTAATALGRIGPAARQAAHALQKAAEQGHPYVRKRARPAHKRILLLLAGDELPLPGESRPMPDAVFSPDHFAFAAVAKATGEAWVVKEGYLGPPRMAQRVQWVMPLGGNGPTGLPALLEYTVHLHERPLAKGEQVIWIVAKDHRQQFGGKALPDTPENRRWVKSAVDGARRLAGLSVEQLAERVLKTPDPEGRRFIFWWFLHRAANRADLRKAMIGRIVARIAEIEKDPKLLLHEGHTGLIECLGDLKARRELVAIMDRQAHFGLCVGTALANALAACGRPEDAWALIRYIPKSGGDGKTEVLHAALQKLTRVCLAMPRRKDNTALGRKAWDREHAALWRNYLTKHGIVEQPATQPATGGASTARPGSSQATRPSSSQATRPGSSQAKAATQPQWGQAKSGVRIGLSPKTISLDPDAKTFTVRVWYENVSRKPRVIPVHKDANMYKLMFAGSTGGKPFYVGHLARRARTIPPRPRSLKAGERFSETFRLGFAHPGRRDVRFYLPRPEAGKTLTLRAGWTPFGDAETAAHWNDPRTRTSGAITVRHKVRLGLIGRLVVTRPKIAKSGRFQVNLELRNYGWSGSPGLAVQAGNPLLLDIRVTDAKGKPVPPTTSRTDVVHSAKWSVIRPFPGERLAVPVSIRSADGAKSREVRNRAEDLLVQRVPGPYLRPHAEAIIAAARAGKTDSALLLGKSGTVQAMALLNKGSRIRNQSETKARLALARLGDAAIRRQFVQAFQTAKDVNKKARLAQSLGYIGDKACAVALAPEMRCPVVYVSGGCRKAFRVDVMEALSEVYPTNRLFWRQDSPDETWYANAERWLQANLGVTWKAARPPFFCVEPIPHPAPRR